MQFIFMRKLYNSWCCIWWNWNQIQTAAKNMFVVLMHYALVDIVMNWFWADRWIGSDGCTFQGNKRFVIGWKTACAQFQNIKNKWMTIKSLKAIRFNPLRSNSLIFDPFFWLRHYPFPRPSRLHANVVWAERKTIQTIYFWIEGDVVV